ncbi:hypothetical protein ACQP3D_28270 [Escherichia coli]
MMELKKVGHFWSLVRVQDGAQESAAELVKKEDNFLGAEQVLAALLYPSRGHFSLQ